MMFAGHVVFRLLFTDLYSPSTATSFRTLASGTAYSLRSQPSLRQVHSLLGLCPKPPAKSLFRRRHGGYRVRGFARTRWIPSRGNWQGVGPNHVNFHVTLVAVSIVFSSIG
jgi:hypothetical protein